MIPSDPVFNPHPRGETMHEPHASVLSPSLPFHHPQEALMADDRPNQKGPNTKKKQKCKNCEGKGLLKKGEKVVKCQRCHGTGLR
jgi:hypothetical protein